MGIAIATIVNLSASSNHHQKIYSRLEEIWLQFMRMFEVGFDQPKKLI